MRSSTTPLRFDTALLALLAVVVAMLSIGPMARLLFEGLASQGQFDLSLAREVLTDESTHKATLRSLLTATGGTVVSVVLGVSFALLVALTDIRAKSPLVFCFMVPLMIPPQITALSWIQLFGPSSALLNLLGIAPPLGTPHPLYTPHGIMLLLGVQHAPLVFLALRAALRFLPREMVEAARVSGAGHAMVLRTIVLPLMTPALVTGTALAFVSGIGNFGIPAMLGIPNNYTTLPVLIYQRLSGFGPSIIAEVAVLSILVGVIAFAGVLVQGWVLRRADFRISGTPAQALAFKLGRLRAVTEAFLWGMLLLILVVPLIALFTTSLVPGYGVVLSWQTATVDAYHEVIFNQSSTFRAFSNSFILAGSSAIVLVVLSIVLGYFLVWRRSTLMKGLSLAAELPYALPGVVLAIACILVFIKPIPFTDSSIYGTLWIIFAAYLARFLALALRPVIAGYEQTDRALEEAAQSAGAPFIMRLRTIIAPVILPMAVAGGILVFMTAFNELTVSALLWSSGTETLGVLVYNLDDGGYTVLATAVAVLAVLAIIAIMLAAQMLSRHFPAGVLPWQA